MTREEFEAYLKTEQGEELLPHIDRLKTAAIKTYRENHPVIEADQTPDTEALAAKEAEILKLKIGNQVIRECQRREIPEDFLTDLGVTFETVEEVGERMERIGARFEDMRIAKINSDMANGFKPGVSATSETDSLKSMSAERALFLESIGELDQLIES